MRGVNLIPVHRKQAADRQRQVRRWLAGGGLYSVLLLGICTLVELSGGQERAVAISITNANGRVAELQRSVNAARTELSNAVAARSTLSMLADPPDWSLLLIGLTSSTGSEAVLRDIRLTSQQAPANGIEQPQTFELRLNGICRSQPTVSAFVQQLQHAGLFSRVELLRSSREPFESGTGVAFDILCAIGNRAAEESGSR